MTTQQLLDDAVTKVIRKDSLEYQEMMRLLQEASEQRTDCLCHTEYYTCLWHEAYYDLLEVL